MQTDAVINEARLTLDRLLVHQLRFFQQHQRYAKASELPSLQVLAPEVAAQYRLTAVIHGGAGCRLKLLPLNPTAWPALSVDHTGRRTGAVSDA